MAQLLEPPVAPSEPAIAAVAEETLIVLREIQEAMLDLIDRSQVATQ
ncbi:hypothetical protein [Nonomuraea sp. 10N515B]